ncbi:TPA: hypothetical protein ACH3X3_004298 [Trebouxia sp. C0006]
MLLTTSWQTTLWSVAPFLLLLQAIVRQLTQHATKWGTGSAERATRRVATEPQRMGDLGPPDWLCCPGALGCNWEGCFPGSQPSCPVTSTTRCM